MNIRCGKKGPHFLLAIISFIKIQLVNKTPFLTFTASNIEYLYHEEMYTAIRFL
jgi:hypothetical protein